MADRVAGASQWNHSGDGIWIRTWGASPRPEAPIAFREGLAAGFAAEQTLRQRLRVSVGGTVLRFRFSNEFGEEPLLVGGASAASVEGYPRINRTITFGGETTVAIPVGTFALSDAIALEVAPLQELDISLFLPRKTAIFDGFAPTAFQGVAVSSGGDFTKADEMPAIEALVNRYLLTGVDVLSSDKTTVIVAFGDSITQGNEQGSWPRYFAERVNLSKAGSVPMAVVNSGIGGNQLRRHGFGESALARFDRDVLTVPGVTHVVVLLGTNDIGMPGTTSPGGGAWISLSETPTANEMIFAYQQLIKRSRDLGLKVYGGTLIPFVGCDSTGRTQYNSPQKDELRRSINQWIRSSGAFDAVIDFEAAMQAPFVPGAMNPQYDSGDHIHPNNDGYRAMADSVDWLLFR